MPSGPTWRRRVTCSPPSAATSRARWAATSTIPTLWVLVTRWESVGAYRRALSAYDVKLHAWTTLGRALDEPGAYENAEPGADLNTASTRSLG